MAKCSSIFDRLIAMHDDRKKEITKIFESYRSEVARIETRYSKQVADEKLGALVSTSRASIVQVHERTEERAQIAIDELRDELRKHLLAPLDPALMAQLRAARDFGLTLSRSELECFADAAKGNLLALRCIQSVAEESGYRMTFTNGDDLSQDLDAVERAFQPSSWAPDGFGREALEILPDAIWKGVNQGRPDGIRVATARAAAEGARRNLELGRERWGRIGDPDAASVFSLERLPSQTAQNAP